MNQIMTKGAAIGLVVLFVLLGFGVFFNYWTTQNAKTEVEQLVRESQHRWCATLNLLTSTGPPKPSTGPIYNRSLTFYEHLKDLEHNYGCD